jgi:hypothetical protein
MKSLQPLSRWLALRFALVGGLIHRKGAKDAKKDGNEPLRPLRLCGEKMKYFNLNECNDP